MYRQIIIITSSRDREVGVSSTNILASVLLDDTGWPRACQIAVLHGTMVVSGTGAAAARTRCLVQLGTRLWYTRWWNASRKFVNSSRIACCKTAGLSCGPNCMQYGKKSSIAVAAYSCFTRKL